MGIKTMTHFSKLFRGNVGKVVNPTQQYGGYECLVIDGVGYDIGKPSGNIDNLIDKHGTDNIVLFKEVGPQGEGCYEGYIAVGKEYYHLDIMNGYRYSKLVKIRD